MGGHRLQVVFLDPRRDGLRDLVKGRIDDGRAVLQAHDLVFVLDGPGILHDALAISDVVAVLKQRQHDLGFDDVHADTDLLLVHAVVVQDHVEILEKALVALPGHGQGAVHGAVGRERGLGYPGAIELFGGYFGAETEYMRISVARHDGVAPHVVHFGRGHGGGGGVALVAGVEQQQAFHVEFVHVFLDARYAVFPHAVHVHPLLIVHLHHSNCAFSHRESPWLLRCLLIVSDFHLAQPPARMAADQTTFTI